MRHWRTQEEEDVPVELMDVLVGVELGAVRRLVEEEVADEPVVVTVVLAVHGDGARAGAAAHNAGRKRHVIPLLDSCS